MEGLLAFILCLFCFGVGMAAIVASAGSVATATTRLSSSAARTLSGPRMRRLWAGVVEQLPTLRLTTDEALCGSVSDFAAEVRYEPLKRGAIVKNRTSITLAGPRLPGDIAIRHEEGRTLVEFTDRADFAGPPASAADVLRPETRTRLDALTRGGVLRLGERLLSYERTGLIETAGGVVSLISELIALAGELADDFEEVPARLALAARRADAPEEARARALDLLATGYPTSPLAQEIVREGLDDVSPVVQLAAAWHVGEEAADLLADLVCDDEVDEELREDALLTAALNLPDAALASICEELAEDLPILGEDLAGALLRIVRSERVAAAFEPLVQLMSVCPPEVAPELPHALAAAGGARAEVPLLELLEHRDHLVRRAAVVALGRVGSPRAIPALRELEQGDLCYVALDAIHAISEREEDGGRGRLSVAVRAATVRGRLGYTDPTGAATKG